MREITLDAGPEVRVCVFKNSKALVFQTLLFGENGKVGNLQHGELVLAIDTAEDIHAFCVTGYPKRVLEAPLVHESTKAKRFRLDMQIEGEDNLYVKYPSNTVRLLEVSSEGRVRVWMVSIVSQNGVFWVKHTMTHDTQAYLSRNGEEIIIPEAKWKGFGALVYRLLDRKREHLPSIKTRSRKKTSLAIEPNTGVVEYFNIGNMTAHVTLHGGEAARVFWKNMPEDENGFRSLKAGDIVKYENMWVPKGTRYSWELGGVTVHGNMKQKEAA